MVTVKINNKPYKFPTSDEEITVGQHIKLLQTETVIDSIAVFCDIPRETLRTATILGLDRILLMLRFLNEPKVYTKTDKIGPYSVPKDITIESLGQFEDFRSQLKRYPFKEAKDLTLEDSLIVIDIYVTACAIYCQKIRDGKYDFNKAVDMKGEILSYPAYQVIGCGAFFLVKPLHLLNGTTPSYRSTSRQQKKPKRGSKK